MPLTPDLDDLMHTVTAYKSRTFDEELEFIQTKLGGKFEVYSVKAWTKFSETSK